MTKNEFIKQCELRGVCSDYTAEVFAARFPKNYDFTEKDIVAAYREEDLIPIADDEKYLRSLGYLPDIDDHF